MKDCSRVSMAVALTVLLAAGARAQQYLVFDLSGGPRAFSYPVSTLSNAPSGGWGDDCKTYRIVLRRIPAGTFNMGSPTWEIGRYSDEKQHAVTLTRDFYIGVFEMTQRQWELIMGNRPSYFNNPAFYAARPVENVKYNDIRGASAGSRWPAAAGVDASSFLGRLRAKTGLATLDLPTEAQWEYACRAGASTSLNSGKDVTITAGGIDGGSLVSAAKGADAAMNDVGRYWYNGGSMRSQYGDTSVGTAKVGSYRPNAWGLYDMHGNVWEWCRDWYATYGGSVTDPIGASSGYSRCKRGGSWYYTARFCRAANRSKVWPSATDRGMGFRLSADCTGVLAAQYVPAPVSAAVVSTAAAAAPADCLAVSIERLAWPATWPAGTTLAEIWIAGSDADAGTAVVMADGVAGDVSVLSMGTHPGALPAAFAEQADEPGGVPLLVVRSTAGGIAVTTPRAGLTVEGADVPATGLPATWRLVRFAP